MPDVLVLGGRVFLIGDCVVCLSGMVWQQTTNLRSFFGINAKTNAAIWVLGAGLAIMAAEYGMIVLARKVGK